MKKVLILLGLVVSMDGYIQAQPVVSSFSPTSGPIGTVVTITGNNFSGVSYENTVFFGAAKAVVTSASITSLLVIVPASASYHPLTVITNGLTAFSTLPFIVTFEGGEGGFLTSSFKTEMNEVINSSSFSSLANDLDGDGKPEVIVLNYNDNSFSVFRNQSTPGSFSLAPKSDFSTGNNPRNMVIGDMNGDGKPDIATVNSTANTISVFNNTSTPGNISFGAAIIVTTGNRPFSIDLGDLNQDGKPDLAVTNMLANTVSVFKNISSGGTLSFAPKVDYPTGTKPYGIAIGDLDADHKPDLAVVNFASNTLSVYKNQCTLTSLSFAAPVDYITGNQPFSVAIGDLERNGTPDIAVACPGSDAISVFKNSGLIGTISFASKMDFMAGTPPTRVCLEDMDGDGSPDIIITGFLTASFSVIRNASSSGIISFAQPVIYSSDTLTSCVSSGDIDGDGKQDLVIVSGIPTLTLIRNRINEPFIASFSPVTATTGNLITLEGNHFSGATSVTFGGLAAASYTVQSSTQINAIAGDGNSGNVSVTTPYGTTSLEGFIYQTEPPVIDSFYPSSGPIGTQVTITGHHFGTTPANNIVFLGPVRAIVTASKADSITVTVPAGTGYQPLSVTIHHLTAFSRNSFDVTFSDGTTSFSAATFGTGTDYTSGGDSRYAEVADLDGDGKPDIVIPNNAGDNFSVFRNTSTPGIVSFAPEVDFPTTTGPFGTTICDFDGDGKPDIAIAAEVSDELSVYRNTSTEGNISFITGGSLYTGSSPRGITSGDLDGDGKADLVVVNTEASTISIYKNTSTYGNISFNPKIDMATGTQPLRLAINDLNGDGSPDIVVTNSISNTLSVYQNSGNPGIISFLPKVDFPTGNFPLGLAIGDLDGDGKPDIAITNYTGTSAVSVFKNLTTNTLISLAARVDFPGGSNPFCVSIGDLDGDGKPDLAIAYINEFALSLLKNATTAGMITSSSFAPKVDLITTHYPVRVTIADLDNDGVPDLAATYAITPGFTVYRSNLPSISSYAPSSASTGMTVTMTGTNFTGATEVSFGGVAALGFTIVSADTLLATVGEGSSGPIIVTTPLGRATSEGIIYIQGSLLNGTLTYLNTAGTPLYHATVFLKQNNIVVASATTDLTGGYFFSGLPEGDYFLCALTNQAPGGINAADALLALNHFTGTLLLSGLRLSAADVNGSGYVNATDALLIANRFIGLISTFSVGDWVADTRLIHLTGSGTRTENLKIICNGDLNASFVP